MEIQQYARRIQSGQVAWLVAIALGIGGGVGLLQWRSLQAPAEPVTAEAPPEPVAVVALGRIEPEGEVVNIGGPVGEQVKQVVVSEGAFVNQNDVLVYLNSYDERLAERDYAMSQLVEARNQLRAETNFGQAQADEAQTRLEQVDRPQILQAQAQQEEIERLQAELSLAQSELSRFQYLHEQGAIPRQQLDERESAVQQIQRQINQAAVTKSQLLEERDRDIENASAQLRSAQANMRRSQVDTQIEALFQNLELAEARLEKTIIRAPQAGQVLDVMTQAGEIVPESGILQLGDTRQMYVVAEVDEANIGLVEVGQSVTIRDRNGMLTEPLTGQVVQIGKQVLRNQVLDNDPTARADARVIEVKIRLDQSEQVASLTNLQVDTRINVERASSESTSTLQQE